MLKQTVILSIFTLLFSSISLNTFAQQSNQSAASRKVRIGEPYCEAWRRGTEPLETYRFLDVIAKPGQWFRFRGDRRASWGYECDSQDFAVISQYINHDVVVNMNNSVSYEERSIRECEHDPGSRGQCSTYGRKFKVVTYTFTLGGVLWTYEDAKPQSF